jgi:hypothetical protein
VEDGDPLAAPPSREKIAGDSALDVIPADHAEHVREPLLGQQGVGGFGHDHQNSGASIDLRGRNRGARALVAEDRGHASGQELVGRGHGLLAVAIVVSLDHLDGLAEHAPAGIEVSNGELEGLLGRPPRPGIGAGHRRTQTDQDFRPRRSGTDEGERSTKAKQCAKIPHLLTSTGRTFPSPHTISRRLRWKSGVE